MDYREFNSKVSKIQSAISEFSSAVSSSLESNKIDIAGVFLKNHIDIRNEIEMLNSMADNMGKDVSEILFLGDFGTGKSILINAICAVCGEPAITSI